MFFLLLFLVADMDSRNPGVVSGHDPRSPARSRDDISSPIAAAAVSIKTKLFSHQQEPGILSALLLLCLSHTLLLPRHHHNVIVGMMIMITLLALLSLRTPLPQATVLDYPRLAQETR